MFDRRRAIAVNTVLHVIQAISLALALESLLAVFFAPEGSLRACAV